ncbi:MAG: YggS family pyridoxal phosphate-dependent enzyme [Halanaerobiales bacterium]|nr:YggS family pyridoxal phosphate-dependent enzyme [Halanaerobiales bacterium]
MGNRGVLEVNVIERLAEVQSRIQKSAERVNRNLEEITLISVSKFHPIEEIEPLIETGNYVFGESRVQELQEKQPLLPNNVEWHLIGHLQRNKVKYVVRMPNCKCIHSVDSIRLIEEIQRQCELNDREEMDILIQVNIANDDAKFGISPQEVLNLIREVSKFDRVKVRGLMTIVLEVDDPEDVRIYFRKLKELRDQIKAAEISGIEMTELSMGMTGDFEIAIEEGATMVRIGSAIFGARNY